jgi:LysR family glycine cleavage system transcriptional activator
MNGVIAFEAVARHMSVTRAAEELLVSREAVSRHIRGLESYLRITLFVRMHRTLELTPAGREFGNAVRIALDVLAEAASKFHTDKASRRVFVITTIAISYCWLTPRLSKFSKIQPELELHITASDKLADLDVSRIGVGVLYGDGQWVGLNAALLFADTIIPVCSPQYISTHGRIRTPKDLLDRRLLAHDGEPNAVQNWEWWFENAGIRNHPKLSLLGFDSYANVIQAAVEGQGIALGYGPIINDFLRRKDLVKAIDLTFTNTGHGYYLVYPAIKPISDDVKAFGDWVLQEAREYMKPARGLRGR